MKLFLIIGGLFIIIFICIIPLNRDIQEFNVQKNGELVSATITYIPICSGTKIKYFMKSFLDKTLKQENGIFKYQTPLKEIQDLIGARVIVHYKTDVETVVEVIKRFFNTVEKT